jgi:hypothetical protein
MNGKQAKMLRREATIQMMKWFDDQLPEDQRGQATPESVMKQIPQSYVYSRGTARHSAYSYRWFYRAMKLMYKHA